MKPTGHAAEGDATVLFPQYAVVWKRLIVIMFILLFNNAMISTVLCCQRCLAKPLQHPYRINANRKTFVIVREIMSSGDEKKTNVC
jgi:hypothetical protein